VVLAAPKISLERKKAPRLRYFEATYLSAFFYPLGTPSCWKRPWLCDPHRSCFSQCHEGSLNASCLNFILFFKFKKFHFHLFIVNEIMYQTNLWVLANFSWTWSCKLERNNRIMPRYHIRQFGAGGMGGEEKKNFGDSIESVM